MYNDKAKENIDDILKYILEDEKGKIKKPNSPKKKGKKKKKNVSNNNIKIKVNENVKNNENNNNNSIENIESDEKEIVEFKKNLCNNSINAQKTKK